MLKKIKLKKKHVDYKSLSKYYSHNKNKCNRTLIKKVADKLEYYKRFLIEEYLPINKYPYYGHMYSCYRKR